MQHHRTPATATLTRRGFALALGVALTDLLAHGASAERANVFAANGLSKATRVKQDVKNCESMGGNASIEARPGGTSVSCSGGMLDGVSCVHSSKSFRCYS